MKKIDKRTTAEKISVNKYTLPCPIILSGTRFNAGTQVLLTDSQVTHLKMQKIKAIPVNNNLKEDQKNDDRI